jgi:hypothetical protein
MFISISYFLVKVVTSKKAPRPMAAYKSHPAIGE